MKKILLISLFIFHCFFLTSQDNFELVVDYQFDAASIFSEGLAAVKYGDRMPMEMRNEMILSGNPKHGYGYIDKQGNVVIDFQFDKALMFSEGLAAVYKGDKWGYIDKQGNVVIDFQFDKLQNPFLNNSFHEGLAVVNKDGQYGFIDKQGNLVIDYQYKYASYFSEGLAAVYKGGKWGYIDKQGKLVIDYQFIIENSWIRLASSFHEGLAAVKKENKYGYIDKKGNVIIDYQFENAHNFSEELAAVKKEGKYGYIDKKGNVIIDYQYERASRFSEGLANVEDESHYGLAGYIDQTGNIAIDFLFIGTKDFSEGLAAIYSRGRYGFIDKKGNLVIDYQFYDPRKGSFNISFHEGLACVGNYNRNYGYIKYKAAKRIPEVNQKKEFTHNMPPILDISNIEFSTNQLDAGEVAKLSITVKNTGPGEARDVVLFLSTSIIGLDFPSKTCYPTILANGGEETIVVEIKGNLDLPTTQASIKIEIEEPNFNVIIQGKQLTFQTREFRKPELILAQYAIIESQSNNPNKRIDINEIIDLKFAIQNTGPGKAENITIEVQNNQEGVMLLGVENKKQLTKQTPTFSEILSGKYESITYRYFVNSDFGERNLEFEIGVKEKMGKYGLQESISFKINTKLQESGYIRLVENTDNNVNQTVKIQNIPDFIPDVDHPIPISDVNNDKTFALIISNENYIKEENVDFAYNDGNIFKQYCEKTLGIPQTNIRFSPNATYGTMRSDLNWISNVIKAFNGKAKVIFYYSGHGMPDEESKTAYLLPIDGTSSDFEVAISLKEVYSKLTEHPVENVTVFLDACFSGCSRNNIMLAHARSVAIKPKSEVLSGNIVVFSASTGTQTAFPFKEKQHGMFSYFLFKKLQETSGAITYKELAAYISEKVMQQSSVVNEKIQEPQVLFSPDVERVWEKWRLVE